MRTRACLSVFHPVADIPAPAPTVPAPTVPSPEGPETYPMPPRPNTPGSAAPPVSPDDLAKCAEYGAVDVPMTGPEEGPVRRG